MISRKIFLVIKSDLSFLMMVLLLLVIVSSVSLNAQNPPANRNTQNQPPNQNAQNQPANQANRPQPQNAPTLRAPDTLPGTLPEMRTPAYWIAKMSNPDAVILPATEIQNRNRVYLAKMADFFKVDSAIQKEINVELTSRPGLLTSVPDVTTKTPAEIAALVNIWIDREITLLKRGRSTNILGIPYAPWEIQNMADVMVSAKAPEQIKLRAGISVKDSRLRIVPQIRPEYVSSGTGWDMWNYDIVPIATPVKILSTSKDGGFLFVLTERGFGWMNAEEVALGAAEQIDQYCQSRDFFMALGDKVPYYTDSTYTIVAGCFRMGDRLGVKEGQTMRTVLVPVRLITGRVSYQEAWLKKDADVSRGYLPYTRKNIVLESFKLLDNMYDWSGGWYGRDHATQLRDIFATFGFKFPSMGGLLSAYQPIKKIIYPKVGHDAQIAAILSNDPFTTIQICATGHAQLFLGNYNGVPILFDTHGYRYVDSNGNTLMVRRANVGTQALPDYFLTRDAIWFLELK